MNGSVASRVRPHLRWINQVRYLRPTIHMAQDKFQITIDVRGFCKDEIKVKAWPECVLIQGAQQRKFDQGIVCRQFVRKFKLPENCTPKKVESRLSEDGVLTVIAHRSVSDPTDPNERNITVEYPPSHKMNDACYCGDECAPRCCSGQIDPVVLPVREVKEIVEPPTCDNNKPPKNKNDKK